MQLPILYSFRRCPYAMRARLAISVSQSDLQLREVVLKNKPEQLLKASPKATVPVLVLPCGRVIDESLEIMTWALGNSDPLGWLVNESSDLLLIAQCDTEFKLWLDKYKYADRFPEFAQQYYRDRGEEFLAVLEEKLSGNRYLSGDQYSLADGAIFPFVRQFAHVDKRWFDQSQYRSVKVWLHEMLESALFKSILVKYPAWEEGQEIIYFPEH